MRIGSAAATPPATGTWVVLATEDGALGPTGAELDRRSGGGLTRALQGWGGKLKRGQTIELLYPAGIGVERLVVLSLGAPGAATRLDLEAAGGSLAVRLKTLRVGEASVAVEAVGDLAVSVAELAVALATGACLRSYRFDRYRTVKEDEDPGEVDLLTLHLAEPAAAEVAWAGAAAVIDGVGHGRDLVSEPANVLTPSPLPRRARGSPAWASRLRCTIRPRSSSWA